MRKVLFLLFFISSFGFSQNKTIPFQKGEFLKYKLSYGLIHAGFATLEVDEINEGNKDLIHIDGNGWTVGMVDFFFSVKDNYQTYFDKNTFQPHRFIRKIDEGGYTKDKEILFDFQKHRATVKDYKNKNEKSFTIQNDINDMLSSFFYLRSISFDNIKQNEIIAIKMFYDDRTENINVKFLGREIIKTKFGEIKTIIIKPEVETDRVFKEKEGVIIWISDDNNKIPIRIKANILVGSIKAELYEFKELANTSTFN